MKCNRLLFLSLLVGSLSLFGCSDSDDPLPGVGSDTGSSARDTGTGGDAGGTTDAGATDAGGTDAGGTDAGGTDAGGADAGGTDAGGTDAGGTDAGGTDAGGTDAGGTDADTPFECGEGVVFTGQVFRGDDEPADSPNGGVPSFTPYDFDAGLQAVIDAAPTDDTPVTGQSLAVTEAIVVATSFNNDTALRAQSQFWVADQNGTIQFFLDSDNVDAQPSFPIRVGQVISFTATDLGNFSGRKQITAASDFSLVSEENAVYFYEPPAGTDLTIDDVPSVVRVTGTLTGDQGGCGGSSNCYDLDYGGTSTITLRTASNFAFVGDCITFAGPMSRFNETPQLDTTNFDWLFDYTFNEE